MPTFATAIKRNCRASESRSKACFDYAERSLTMPTFAKQKAEIAQLVEHNLAKVGVASPSLVFRSNKEFFESQ